MTPNSVWESEEQHRLEERTENRLVLNDGSIWEISPHHVPTAAHWIRFSNVMVRPAHEPEYHWLINTSYGQEVKARHVGMAPHALKPNVA